MKILIEDKNIIVVEKAPGEASQPDKKGSPNLMSAIKAHMDAQGEKKKQPFLIHRLDRPVGGLMVYAKTKESAADLSKQVQNNRIRKKYLAVVMGHIAESEGDLKDFLLKDEAANTSSVVPQGTNGAKEAHLKYRVKGHVDSEAYGPLTIVEVLLLTGRHHQIRVQMAAFGHPIWGDTKYNAAFSMVDSWVQIALFSGYLKFIHPATNKPVEVTAKPDADQVPWSYFE